MRGMSNGRVLFVEVIGGRRYLVRRNFACVQVTHTDCRYLATFDNDVM